MVLIPTVRANSNTDKGKKITLSGFRPAKFCGRYGIWKKFRPPSVGSVCETKDSGPKNLPGIDPLLRELLFNRGLGDPALAESFLKPDYVRLKKFGGSAGLLNLDNAVKTLAKYVSQKKPIIIFGDYDVDGVCSAVLMREAIIRVKGRALVMLPHRERDGYGLQVDSLDKILAKKPGLVITVDNGSSSGRAISQLRQKGIEVIVVDHHEVGDIDPSQAILLNPKQKDEQAKFKQLCAAGVAYRLAEALYEFFNVPEGQEKWLLDLVAVATVCDMVPLRGDNRALVYFGLKTLHNTRRPGFKWLLRKISRGDEAGPASAESIGYGIGPRLNAAGRLEDALRAFELVSAADDQAAAQAGEQLEELNMRRRALTRKVFEEADQKALEQKDEASIVVADESWPRGVCGLAAGRLAEKYNKPVFVLEKSEPAVGSGRGVEGFNLAEALLGMKNLFIRAGGHALAAGLTIPTKNIDNFRKKLAAKVKAARGALVPAKILHCELILGLDQIDNRFLDIQERLEPFGIGNQKPVIRVDDCEIIDLRLMGQKNNHLGLRLRGAGVIRRAVLFSKAGDFSDLKIGDRINLLAYVSENNWQGRRSAELQIIDIIKK